MRKILPLLLLILLPLACDKPSKDNPDNNQGTGGLEPATYYGNLFAFNNMKAYYLWADDKDIAARIDAWTYGSNPVEKVAECCYREGGQLVDKWTALMTDRSSFESSVTGNGKSFGIDFVLYAEGEQVVMVVTFVYDNSPAQKAGLKRGDVVVTFDGTTLTRKNYSEVLTEKIYNFPETLQAGLRDGRNLTMTAVQMYSNPVNVVRTLEVNEKKVGYLHFSNFTMDAAQDLVEAFRVFKADGIRELVVDLRYNSGGYAIIAAVLGSMIAPLSVVSSGAVFNKDIYNSNLTPSTPSKAETCFAASFTLPLSGGEKTFNTLEVNPDLKRVWFIVTGQTASASEALICGLAPYMDVALIGSDTYGKFCGGYLLKADEFYDRLSTQKTDFDCAAGKKATDGWGLYVIASRYADCNGVTLSMPNGIPADIQASDDPSDGKQLGDPSEKMLATALGFATGGYAAPASPTKSALSERLPFEKPGAGALLY